MSHRAAVLLRHLTGAASAVSAEPTSAASLPLSYSPEVAEALRQGRPVVALESTIISHGMPYPANVKTAQEVEQVVRSHGATPATIAILDGRIRVGLTPAELETLGKLGHKAQKCSRRDLAYVLATKTPGATTVAATMLIAHMAGISVFVTGGIGGVHRGAESTMDISADLTELGRTPVAVVCAGVKSILDIPKTLEVLETQGVSVVALGTNEFPAFFTPHSGCEAPLRVNSPSECAQMIDAAQRLRLDNGMVIAVPIPPLQAAAAAPLQKAQDQAIAESIAQRVVGRDVTPFLLQRVNELTKGASLVANIALIKNNAKIGAQIAASLVALRTPSNPLSLNTVSASVTHFKSQTVAVVGGNAQDLLARPPMGQSLLMRTSGPGTLVRQWGGVARNVAECLSRCSCPPVFVTAVGADSQGDALIRECKSLGMNMSGTIVSKTHGSPTYLAILDATGDLHTAIEDMEITESITWAQIEPSAKLLAQAGVAVVDGNLSVPTLSSVCDFFARHQIPVVFEPTSVPKAKRIINAVSAGHVWCITPNIDELCAMNSLLGSTAPPAVSENHHTDKNFHQEPIRRHCDYFLRHSQVTHLILKMGAHGVLRASAHRAPNAGVRVAFRHYPSAPIPNLVNTSGAGDSLVGAFVAALCFNNNIDQAVVCGINAARMTLQSDASVSPDINKYSVGIA